MIFFDLNRPHGIDFPQLFEASKMWWQGDNPYLTLLTSPGPFNYPPSSFYFLWWIDLLPFFWSSVLWNYLSVFSFVLSLFLITKLVWKKGWKLWYFFVAALLFTLPFFPEKFNVGNGQMNNFILLFVVLSWWWQTQKKNMLSVFGIAYSIGIKLTPAAFILPFIIEKDWKQVIRIVLCTSVIMLSPILIFGWENIQPYVTAIFFEGFGLNGKDIYYNQSLLAFLLRTVPDSLAVLLFKVSWVVLPLVSWVMLSKIKLERFTISMAVATCLYLMLHPLAWQHHFLFAVIPILVAWKHLPKWLTIISFILIAGNIKQPELVPVWATLFLSNQFLGVFLLWVGFIAKSWAKKS
ncbi:DUF2029 domain-containing protein [Candidatus Woesebacteria bacterium]|nr:DUF2029 domain-containing protein [Candidatus Woesebacteria bacterium]